MMKEVLIISTVLQHTTMAMELKLSNIDHLFTIAITIFLLFSPTMINASPSSPIKAAYWPSWASATFPPSSIDTTLFTHIYYAFLMPHNTTYKLLPSQSQSTVLSTFNSHLHANSSPPVKTLLSMGGGGADPTIFARMAATPATRQTFIDSTIEVAREYGFDGLDLDWEFPKDEKEMGDLGVLLSEWRVAVEREAELTRRTPLLITAAVYFASNFSVNGAKRGYPAESIARNLDWASPMCFDYRGSWDTSATGAHAALFDPNSNISTSAGLSSWVKVGVPANKLVMGLPLYGRTWKLENERKHGIGARAVGLGPGEEGVLTFKQVWDFNKANRATVVYDSVTVSMYSYSGTNWVGYDDRKSVAMKVRFAKALGLRGYFFWSVVGDKDWRVSKQAWKAWGR